MRVSKFIVLQVRFDGEIFGGVLDYAREARAGKNPAGLFMALLKKELGYGDQARR